MIPGRRRPSTGRVDHLGDVRLGLCLLPLLVVPGLFHRSAFTVFTVPKASVVWMSAVLLSGLGLGRLVARGSFHRPRWTVEGVLVLFGVAVVVSAVTSPAGHLAWWGVGVRWSGAWTYLAFLVVIAATSGTFRDRSPLPAVVAGVVGALPVVGYALVQVAGRDPFEWAASLSFGVSVMSTFGNPNFSSAFLAMTVPLALSLALRLGAHPIVRGLTGVVAGLALACIGHLASLQGQIAVVASLLVVAVGVSERRRSGLLASLWPLPVGLAVVVLPLVGGRFGVAEMVGLSLVVGGWCAACPGVETEVDASRRARWLPGNMARWTVAVVVAFVAVGGIVWMARDRILSALGERWEFWRVALEVFADRPLTGLGLETFGTRFAELRGPEHVQISAAHLSDSPHSVPFGLLAGGGIVLACAYGLLVAVTGLAGVRAFRRTKGNERVLVAGLCSAWTAFHLQSLVSVDLPALIVLHAVLAGTLLGIGAGPGAAGPDTPPLSWWRHRPTGVRAGVGVLTGLVVVGLLVGPALRPLRADRAHHQAMVALVRGEAEEVDRHLAEALRAVPTDGILWSLQGEVHRGAGRAEEAYRASALAAELRPGDPVMALRAARDAVVLLARPGYLERATAWYETALAADPLGPHRAEVAGFLRAIGRMDRATDVLAAPGPAAGLASGPVVAEAKP